MTWDECFYKPKLLLAANRLIYLNINQQVYQEFTDPDHLARHSLLHSITTSGETTSRCFYFNAASFPKRVIIFENNYSRENN